MTALKIPYDQLNPEALQAVYEIKLNGLEYLFNKNKSFIRKKNNQ